MDYPKRPQLYALKYIQWLMDSGIVAEIGCDGFALLVTVVMQEDRQRYQRHVNFWTSQLCEKLKISRQTLVTIRNRVVRAGLLDYTPGARQRPAKYLVIGLQLDTVQKLDSIQSESNQNLITSLPIPNPIPKPNKRSAFDPLGIEYPEGLDNPDFKAAWAEFVQHRRDKKSPLTPTSTAKQIKKLAQWGSAKSIEAIDSSIENGWQGIFEPQSRPSGIHESKSQSAVVNDPSQWADAIFDGDDAPPKPLPQGVLS